MDASHSPPPKDLNGCALATKQSLISNTPRHGNIETIDLTNRQVSRAHEKNVPRELIKLNQLHDRTTKGRSATVNPQKKPSFDYTKGERPRLSFLVENSVSGLSSDKGSMGCDEDWIGGLPSPFALSGKQKDESSPFRQEISTNYGSSWHDGLPSPSVILRQDDQVSPVHVDSDSLEDFDLSQFNDDKSDVEAVMVGLSDSLNIQEASRAEGANTQTGLEKDDEAATLDTDNPNDLPFNIEHTGTSALQPGLLATSDAVGQEEKLFFSTDSPEKLVKPKGKREAPGAEEGYHSAPVPKRPRAMGRGDKTLLPSSSIENRISPPVARIKEGQPAWVYEFDPALIAEWQDIVEFV